jgi:3-hydroxyacyl-CoA dehydrogenase/enoyl-CoA hydratase/3-hydroxybutyryl-CoA epimerase
MGPLELLDEVGFDIAGHAADSLHAAYGERMVPSAVLGRMLADERLGRKNGRGFYLHEEKAKVRGEKRLDPAIAKYASAAGSNGSLGPQQIADLMILSMVNEAARCLEEKVAEGPSELDLATVFGMGFPPFRGGLLRYADSLGAAEVVARLRSFAESPAIQHRQGGPAKFAPAASLLKMASAGTSFYPR